MGHPTRQPRAGSRSRVLDPRPQDPNRKTTGSGHYTASSGRISTLLAKIPKSRQDIHSSTLGLVTSYQMSKIQPYRRVHKVNKFSTDHGSSGDPPVSRCSGKVGKLDPAISQILLIPLHHTATNVHELGDELCRQFARSDSSVVIADLWTELQMVHQINSSLTRQPDTQSVELAGLQGHLKVMALVRDR
ncbi:unnamed protein product [Phytophthora fragariaefolia]|uniref:Unnamed protein product n=1 Tax=Phytophthora fragariaefolia TaxID=1490495 RepID=A0A9W7D3J0_9STRA|nr:unnamed protein product [Phytophthora fragariaefolia]